MKTKCLILVILLGLVIAACGCAAPQETTPNEPQMTAAEVGYRTITAENAKAMMDETEDWILLDVRTAEEFQEVRIEGAILIPDYEIADRAESEIPDKETTILIYCRSGRRSALAAQEMVGMGYTNVYDFGGIIDWSYDTITG